LKENENEKKLMNIFEKEIMVIMGCTLSRNTLYTLTGISKKQRIRKISDLTMFYN